MIARVYAELIRKGMKKLSDVPASIREAVEAELNKMGAAGDE